MDGEEKAEVRDSKATQKGRRCIREVAARGPLPEMDFGRLSRSNPKRKVACVWEGIFAFKRKSPQCLDLDWHSGPEDTKRFYAFDSQKYSTG